MSSDHTLGRLRNITVTWNLKNGAVSKDFPDSAAAVLFLENEEPPPEWQAPPKPVIYEGLIEPGMVFMWEPNTPAWSEVEVTLVEDVAHDERRIHNRILRAGRFGGVGRVVWNDESHFRAAVRDTVPEVAEISALTDLAVVAEYEAEAKEALRNLRLDSPFDVARRLHATIHATGRRRKVLEAKAPPAPDPDEWLESELAKIATTTDPDYLCWASRHWEMEKGVQRPDDRYTHDRMAHILVAIRERRKQLEAPAVPGDSQP